MAGVEWTRGCDPRGGQGGIPWSSVAAVRHLDLILKTVGGRKEHRLYSDVI